MTRRRARCAVLAATVGASAVGVVAFSVSAKSAEQIPLLGGGPSYYIERDMPKAVQERAIRQQKQVLSSFRGAVIQEPSLAAGCRPTDFPGSIGPPAPDVTARVIGYHVEVVVRFETLPRALACRPWGLSIAISGKSINPQGSIPWVQTFELQGPVGRAVTRLPLYTVAPYKLQLYAQTIQGRRSKRVEKMLSCPSGGCVAGDAPKAHKSPERRRFPLRGVSRSQLETSFREGLDAVGRSAPNTRHTASCHSLTACEATFTDPLFPNKPQRIRFLIGGEQVEHCWAVTGTEPLNDPPYEDLPTPSPYAGCVDWPE